MYRFLFLVGCVLIPSLGYGQTAKDFTRRFEQSHSGREFLVTFDSMIHQFHSGKLEFEHDDVTTIVSITQQKTYADSLLPAVFSWARTMFANGRVQEGLTFFMESADHYQRSGNQLGQAVCFYEIAIIQHKAENFAEAEKYYRMAIDQGLRILPYRTTINCLNGLAMILRERSELALAKAEFRKALSIADEKRDTAWIGILLGNIGSCHMAEKNYDSSLWYYNRNLYFIRRTGEFENEIETYANLGRIYIQTNDLKVSKLYLDSAVHIIQSRKINFNDFFNPMDQIHESYSMLYSKMGDFENAYQHYLKFHSIAKQKQENINSRSLRQLESVWQFQKNQNEIDLLKKINQQQRYISWSFALLILLLGGITLYAFRRARSRKKINRQLSATNSELGRLNEVKDMLFSVISHDLRGPIANLRSTLELLRTGNLRPEELSMLTERIGRQLEVSGSALENILQWAKAQLNDGTSNPAKIHLSDLVATVYAQVQLNAANKHITVENEVDKDVVIFADKDQMEVVIRNLLTNAIKFTPAGGRIKIKAERVGESIRLIIEDTGVGMSREQIHNLFKPNRHHSTEGTNREKGTGIGLIIAREMIRANGGSISVESEKECGTTFRILIPTLSKHPHPSA